MGAPYIYIYIYIYNISRLRVNPTQCGNPRGFDFPYKHQCDSQQRYKQNV